MTCDNNWKDLEAYKACTKIYELQFRKNGLPEDITGWTIFFTVKENMNDTDINAKISKDITTHTDPINGISVITLSATDTDIDMCNYYYDIKYIDDENNAGILFRGRLKIIKPVTTRS